MTAVLEIQGRGRTTFCRPVPSRALGSPPAGPYGGPGRLRTLVLHHPKGNSLPCQVCSLIQSRSTQIHNPLKYTLASDCAPEWLNISNSKLQANQLKGCIWGGFVFGCSVILSLIPSHLKSSCNHTGIFIYLSLFYKPQLYEVTSGVTRTFQIGVYEFPITNSPV